MKKAAIIALMTLCLPAVAQTDKQEPAVVILTAGQSNTDGRVGNDELPNYIKRDGYKYCQWSFGSGVHSGNGQFKPFFPRIYSQNKPERWAYDAVVYYLLEQQLQRPFYVIKESLGGTAIDTLCRSNSNMHWSADPAYLQRTAASDKGGLSLLKAFTENIGACIDNHLSKLPEGYDIKAMLWHQGESDSSQADRYYNNLKAVVTYVRTYLVNKTGQQKYAHLPFICGTFSKQSKQGNAKVIEAMLRLKREDPDFHVVDVSDATLQKDQIHFDAAGAELLGKRMYKQFAVKQVVFENHQLSINGDEMPWLLQTDGSQYEWVTDKCQWGNTYYNADGDIAVKTELRQEGDDLVETYVFTNTSKRKVTMKNIGIYTPFNDNYPDAKTCMTSRCNVHIWPGGKAAYVNAMRMSGVGSNLGLMVTEGEITDYDVWERGSKKGMSNFRGVFALCPPDMTLKPGQSYRLTWRLFSHNGTDFDEQLLHRGGMVVRSKKYVYAVGETARVDFITSKGTKTITKKITTTGEQRVDYKGTHALLLGISGGKELLDKRVRFILEHQQMNDSNDPRYGAFMVYDNEGDSILTDGKGRSDLDEGRERVGLGILLAEYCRQHPDEKMQEALVRYAKFVREKMQQKDYTTGSSVMRKPKNRGYNYPWVADFYFRMYLLTGNKQYVLDGYATLRSLYRYFGYGFYCIDYPVTVGLKALEQAGLTFERDQLLYDFKTTADIYLKNGLDFPKFEVNYEQSIIAPAVQFLCEVYLATGEKRYLRGAEQLLPALKALQWHQPSYHMNEIAIRHWDGYWFGKRQTYGDVYPHYWSAITAAAYHYYAKATGNQAYQQCAENIVRNNLSLFYEDGKATCAFVYPRRVNGEPAHYADAYANDQDWALMYYMLVNLNN